MRRGSALAGMAVCLVLAGCFFETKPNVPTIGLDNTTDGPVKVIIVGVPENHEYATPIVLEPRRRSDISVETDNTPESCVGTGAIALDEDGKELARLAEPLCGRHVWTIDPVAGSTYTAYP